MREDDEDYDMEEELEEVKDILMTEKVDCPNCRSKVDANLDKCPLCGYALKKVEDEEFTNKLKATMWAPGMDRGVPIGKEMPPPAPSDVEDLEDLDSTETETAEPELPFLTPTEEEEEEVVGDKRLFGEVLVAGEKLKVALSVALILVGEFLYIFTPFFSVVGVSVLIFMVIGSVLLLVGANVAFDVILERRKRMSLSSEREMQESFPRITRRVLVPGDSVGKTVSVLITFVGGLSYVLLPMFVDDRMLVFVGMAVGAVLIVFGVSLVHHAFFRTEYYREKKKEHVFEAFVETLPEEPLGGEEIEWACPVCATPLAEETDVCPECGAEFED
ncbi:MAG: hypothetical protein JSV43_04105 [Methanobacteriota archaeon]|nr:MAG: hypothetical protein JSV43_04105 [Euryarchaeota archaeon]